MPDPGETSTPLVYVVAETGRRTSGTTRPRRGSIAAVLKEDGTEVPTCVYNELIAARLAELCGAPLAAGVLSDGPDRPRFASLVAATAGARLPPIDGRLAPRAAARYPDEAAALLVFDVFVGNWDRQGNVKAATATARTFFCGFDHSHALLTTHERPDASIEALGRPQLILRQHMFSGHVSPTAVAAWSSRVQLIPDEMVRQRCFTGTVLPSVTLELQRALAEAMVRRKAQLPELCAQLLETTR